MFGVVAREYVPRAWEKGGDVARVWVGMEVEAVDG